MCLTQRHLANAVGVGATGHETLNSGSESVVSIGQQLRQVASALGRRQKPG
jgi:hypothetical protein